MSFNEMLATLDSLNGIYRNSKEIELGEFKINVTDIKVSGSFDDSSYSKSKQLWEVLPRCFAIVQYNGNIIRVICGLRKFGSEDEFRHNLSQNEDVGREIYLNKANGEYFSFSCFKIGSILFFALRSKNVTVVLREGSFIEDLHSDNYNFKRYGFVSEMALAFWELFKSLRKDQQNDIIQKGLTHIISMESCSKLHQHLVDYELENDNEHVFYPFALTKYTPSSEGLTSMMPLEAQRWFNQVGLGSLPFVHEVDFSDEEERKRVREKVFNEENSEGAVVYQISKDRSTGNERVSHVYKYKNYRYIFWRGVREKIRSRVKISTMVNRLRKFHCEIPNLDSLIKEAIQFYAYCWLTVTKDNWYRLFDKWVDKFNDFKKLKNEEKDEYKRRFILIDQQRKQLQLMPIGIPGSGKSTLLKSLDVLLPDSFRVNQDECGKSPKIYGRKLAKLSRDDNIRTLLLDKCNHSLKVRKGSYGPLEIKNLVYIVFYHPDDVALEELERNHQSFKLDNALNLSKVRIHIRGEAHLNLYPNGNLNRILEGFRTSYEFLTREEIEECSGIVYLDSTMKPGEMVKQVIERIRAMNITDEETVPDLTQIDIDTAVKAVSEEEVSLRRENKKLKIKYWSALVVNPEQVFGLPEVLDVLDKFGDMKTVPDPHCTLLYVGTNKKISEEDLLSYEGELIDIRVDSVCYDDKIIALKVDVECPCDNEVPHITLHYDRSVRPVYSNEMLKDPCEIVLRESVYVKARVVKVFN